MGVEVKGDAWTIKTNAQTSRMTEGDVLLTYEGRGHASLILGFEGRIVRDSYTTPEFIKVIERWPQGESCIIRTRLIPWGDERIRGVYRPTTLFPSSPL